MERKIIRQKRNLNWILTGAAVLFAALVIVVCLLLRPKGGEGDRFVIHYGNGETIAVSASETRIIAVQNGKIVEKATEDGEENIIHIENGVAWMEYANCPHRECMKQGKLSKETAKKRPLGTWIVCAPHRVYIELAGGTP